MISQNGPKNLCTDSSPGKLPRDLTEPAISLARRRVIHVERAAALRDLISAI